MVTYLPYLVAEFIGDFKGTQQTDSREDGAPKRGLTQAKAAA